MQPTVQHEIQPRFEQMIGENFGAQAALEAAQPAPTEASFQIPEAQAPAQLSEGLAAAFALSMQIRRSNPELAKQILGLGAKSEVVVNHAAAFARQQEMEHQARAYAAQQNDKEKHPAYASAE